MTAPRDWRTDRRGRGGPWVDPQRQDQDDADRQTEGLAGVAVVLMLLVVGLFLVHTLSAKSKIEDCLMAGRANCDKLVNVR